MQEESSAVTGELHVSSLPGTVKRGYAGRVDDVLADGQKRLQRYQRQRPYFGRALSMLRSLERETGIEPATFSLGS